MRKVLQKLESEGYTEFYREVRIDTHRGMFFIDLVAIKGGEIVAVECGETDDFKLDILCNYFENVLWFKYNGDVINLRGKASQNPYNILKKHILKGSLYMKTEGVMKNV